ncbi:MAG TPA: hypothetical protein VGG40_08110 [Solirubrobacterales bacterium]
MTAASAGAIGAPGTLAARGFGDLRRPVPTMLGLAIASAVVVGALAAYDPVYGAVAVVGIAIALYLAQRPVIAAYSMVLVAPACAGFRRGLPVPGLRASELVIVALSSLILVFGARVNRRWSRVELLLLAYAVATAALGGLDLALRRAPLELSELGTLIGPFEFVLLVRAVAAALPEERQRERAIRLLIVGAVVVSLVAIAQILGLGPTRSILRSVTGSNEFEISLTEGIGRATGPFELWHALAGFLMPSVLLSFGLLLDAGSDRRRLLYGAAVAITLAALLASAALGPLAMTLLGFVFIAWRRRSLHLLGAIVVPAAAVVIIAFGGTYGGRAEQQYSQSRQTYRTPFVPQTIAYRVKVFEEQSEPALAKHWISGYGPDLPPQIALSEFPFTESAYVTLLLRGGVPLLLIFLTMLAAVLRAAYLAVRRARGPFAWTVAAVVGICTINFLVLQLLESHLLDAGPPQAYWTVVGIMLAAGSGAPRGSRDG